MSVGEVDKKRESSKNSQDENLPDIGVPGLEMDKETQKKLYELDAEQNNVDLMNHKERQELQKIDQKYSKLMRPYLDKRNEIIKRVPKFWLTTVDAKASLLSYNMLRVIFIFEFKYFCNGVRMIIF